jgi:hypothetical protein
MGIDSSAAHSDTNGVTALGCILNTAFSTWDDQAVSDTDVLVKFTYYGDANLNGIVDNSTDLGLLNNGQSNGLTGWYNGDFNYDGVINGSDYTLYDLGYNFYQSRNASSPTIVGPSEGSGL